MEFVERFISYVGKNRKGYDDRLYTRNIPGLKEPTLDIIGPSDEDFQPLGPFPTLCFTPPEGTVGTLLVSQDPDTPIGCLMHGLYYNIPPTVTKLTAEDFPEDASKFKWGLGKSFRGTVYTPPKPLINHGSHRYFFQVICINKHIEVPKEGDKYSEVEFRKMIKDENVLAWGEFVGACSRSSKK